MISAVWQALARGLQSLDKSIDAEPGVAFAMAAEEDGITVRASLAEFAKRVLLLHSDYVAETLAVP